MKIQLGVLFGGKSTEHEISIISAVQAMYAVDTEKYEVVPLYITKDNRFYTGEALKKIENYKDIPALLRQCERVALAGEGDIAGIYRFPPKPLGKNRIGYIDVALPVVHGTNTEDGTLMGYLEMLNLPYAGCDVCSSALGMDKYAMKAMFRAADIPVLDAVLYTTKDYDAPEAVMDEIEKRFGYPVIVKPSNLGSSIGISVAAERAALRRALENAFSFTQTVLVERAVKNLREINCAVLGDRFAAEASECEEPLAADEILSFENKYMASGKGGRSGAKGMAGAGRKIPADIPNDLREEIRALAVQAFRCLGCCGVSRVDFLIDCDENKVYLNEINTIPGSLSFYLWEPVGLSYTQLLDRMIELGMKRARARAGLTYSFDSNVLQGIKLGGAKGAKR